MAKKYIIFKSQNNFSFIRSKLAEINITLTDLGDGKVSVTFPDGLSANFKYYSSWNTIVADASTDLLMISSSAPTYTYKNTGQEEPVNFAYVFIAKKTDDTLYSNNGYAGASTQQYLKNIGNFSQLDTQYHNDTSLQTIDLVNFSAELLIDSDYTERKPRPVFKYVYINYQRWFEFGTVIVDSNGNEYIANGWVLCRVNIDS